MSFRTNKKHTSADESFFWERVSFLGDCWNWLAGKNKDGYGRIRIDGRSDLAHRVAYRLTYGPIPDGLLIRHECDNPSCVNPNHLEVGTLKDNAQDCVQRVRKCGQTKTHCPHGHEYTPENTYCRPSSPNKRMCRTCHRDRMRSQQMFLLCDKDRGFTVTCPIHV